MALPYWCDSATHTIHLSVALVLASAVSWLLVDTPPECIAATYIWRSTFRRRVPLQPCLISLSRYDEQQRQEQSAAQGSLSLALFHLNCSIHSHSVGCMQNADLVPSEPGAPHRARGCPPQVRGQTESDHVNDCSFHCEAYYLLKIFVCI